MISLSYIYFQAMKKVANKLLNGRITQHTMFGQRIHSQENGGEVYSRILRIR